MKDENGSERTPLPWQMALANDVGAIKEGVGTLKGQVQGLTQQVAEVKATMVKQTDCQQHMREVQDIAQLAQSRAEEANEAAEEAALQAENTARHEIAKLRGGRPSDQVRPISGMGYPAVKPAAPAALTLWERVVKKSQGISAVITLTLLVGGLLLAISHFVGRVEALMKRADEEQRQTQQLVKRLTQQRLDAAAEPAAK